MAFTTLMMLYDIMTMANQITFTLKLFVTYLSPLVVSDVSSTTSAILLYISLST